MFLTVVLVALFFIALIALITYFLVKMRTKSRRGVDTKQATRW
jgi:heme/copper-type cytochrome/quinol oxidase subunit 2